jgi:hypothetical protein
MRIQRLWLTRTKPPNYECSDERGATRLLPIAAGRIAVSFAQQFYRVGDWLR